MMQFGLFIFSLSLAYILLVGLLEVLRFEVVVAVWFEVGAIGSFSFPLVSCIYTWFCIAWS
jgi:hypothetical protein